MKATGIVVEYNPFHNGHLHHVEQTRKETGADVVVAVMSGHFLQRGEPALVSKWARTSMALASGVDLVVELPYAFSVQHADVFSRGAIAILDALHCRAVCFGSESGNADEFQAVLATYTAERERWDELVRHEMKQGARFPQATAKAFEAIGATQLNMSLPNNILGFSYGKAIVELNSSMTLHTILRVKAGYHEPTATDHHIASATAIRNYVQSGEPIAPFIPRATALQLDMYHHLFGTYHSLASYYPFIRYRILTMTSAQLSAIYEVDEGFENRLIEAAWESSFADFFAKLTTKRYTNNRIQRMLIHILTNTTKVELAKTAQPEYIRLLGMNERGRNYLQKVKKQLKLPLLSRLGQYASPQLELDVKATRAYAMILSDERATQLMRLEHSQPPIYRQEHEE